MEFGLWASMIVLFAAGGLTPGPAVMLVIAASLRYGFWLSLVSGLGICAANVVWITLAASGAGALAEQFPTGFFVLKLVGLGFVLWLAWSTATQPVDTNFEDEVTDVFKPKGQNFIKTGRITGLFLRGFGLQLANPNALVFFGGLLPAFFNVDAPIIPQVIIMVLTVTATELVGLSIYGSGARLLSHKFSEPKFARVFYVCAATLMAGSVVWALVSPYL